MAETAWFRTEGGSVIEMDLPLHEAIEQRVTKGAIVRVANADGDPYIEPTTGEESAPPERPAQSANKDAWVGYAVHAHGLEPDDADAMTKQDLIEKFGKD